jgi:hypothetical protein
MIGTLLRRLDSKDCLFPAKPVTAWSFVSLRRVWLVRSKPGVGDEFLHAACRNHGPQAGLNMLFRTAL